MDCLIDDKQNKNANNSNSTLMETHTLSHGQLPALSKLMHDLQLQSYFDGEVSIQGSDPVLCSPHRLGEAVSTLLTINGIAAAAIWRYRTQQKTNLQLSMYDAIHHLHSPHFLWQSGLKLSLGAEYVYTNGLYPCKDGRFIMIEAGPPYAKLQNGYLNFLHSNNDRQGIASAIANWSSDELEEALSAASLPACIARTRDEWRSHPQGAILANTPFIEIEKIAPGEPQPFSANPSTPLSNIKVLDCTHVLAGPHSAHTLAEYGANVLHISSPYHQDTTIQNLLVNPGKRSAYLDFANPNAAQKMRELLAETDVFTLSYRPQVAKRYQITAHDAAKLNKKGIIYLSINAYGHSGPWRDRPGFDQNGQAVSGVAVSEGSLSAPRFTPVFYLNDLITGYSASAGIMAALLRRAVDGGSYHVRVSLARGAMWVQDLGYLAPELYNMAPKEDQYPAQLETTDTAYGPVTCLAPAIQFSNMPRASLRPVVPYGADTPNW
jgi:crotonobetainyl-CoA:carnitine CoA-transferase CaiB-like acyl-CoA transferase